MPKVTFIHDDGQEESVEVSVGTSLMMAATQNSVEGIEAECGGCCMCATCHVYVEEAFLDKLTPPDELEQEMLEETAAEAKSNSRLSCQIPVTDALDGLVVRLPERQV